MLVSRLVVTLTIRASFALMKFSISTCPAVARKQASEVEALAELPQCMFAITEEYEVGLYWAELRVNDIFLRTGQNYRELYLLFAKGRSRHVERHEPQILHSFCRSSILALRKGTKGSYLLDWNVSKEKYR